MYGSESFVCSAFCALDKKFKVIWRVLEKKIICSQTLTMYGSIDKFYEAFLCPLDTRLSMHEADSIVPLNRVGWVYPTGF